MKARTISQGLMILASLVASGFWLLSAMQPLALTLDSMEAELKAAAWYNKNAAWAACVAAFCQFLGGICAYLQRRGR